MLTDFTQRHSEGIVHYRFRGDLFCPRLYDVAPISETEAKDFILAHHYSRSYPAARRRFGLFRAGQLVGAAVFSHPTNDKTLTNMFGGKATDSLELGRFVLLDEVPFNAESWFFARCREHLLPEGFRGILSFADDFARRDINGSVVHRGHLGTIYAASNGLYVGRSSPTPIYLLPDGSVLSKRAVSKIRNSESGFQYAARLLQSFGASPVNCDPALWLEYWMPRLTRKYRHPGNHKYLFPMRKGLAMPKPLPYPKFPLSDLQAALF